MTSPDPACASGWFTPGTGYRGLNPIDFRDPCKNPSFQMGYDVFYHEARMSEKKGAVWAPLVSTDGMPGVGSSVRFRRFMSPVSGRIEELDGDGP